MQKGWPFPSFVQNHRHRVFEIGNIPSLIEPIVDLPKQIVRFLSPGLIAPISRNQRPFAGALVPLA